MDELGIKDHVHDWGVLGVLDGIVIVLVDGVLIV